MSSTELSDCLALPRGALQYAGGKAIVSWVDLGTEQRLGSTGISSPPQTTEADLLSTFFSSLILTSAITVVFFSHHHATPSYCLAKQKQQRCNALSPKLGCAAGSWLGSKGLESRATALVFSFVSESFPTDILVHSLSFFF